MDELSLDEEFRDLYYNPTRPPAFGSARKLLRSVSSEKRGAALDWLRGQDAYTLHKPTQRVFQRRKTVAGGVGEQLQADLMDVSNVSADNDGVRFILTAVDVVSRFAYAEPLPNKRGASVASKLAPILDASGVRRLQTDKGKEFYNADVGKVCAERKVLHFSTGDDEVKAAMVERFNRSLRDKLHRYMTFQRSDRYVDVLPQLVEGYNSTVNSATGLAPADVDVDNQEEVFLRQVDKSVKEHIARKPNELEVGDYVRLTARRMPFSRGYRPKWTEEVFIVNGVYQMANPTTYSVKDWSGEELEGRFYAAELQRIKKPDTFRVEKILRRRRYKRTNQKEYLVKWLNYPDSFNSWVHENDIDPDK